MSHGWTHSSGFEPIFSDFLFYFFFSSIATSLEIFFCFVFLRDISTDARNAVLVSEMRHCVDGPPVSVLSLKPPRIEFEAMWKNPFLVPGDVLVDLQLSGHFYSFFFFFLKPHPTVSRCE